MLNTPNIFVTVVLILLLNLYQIVPSKSLPFRPTIIVAEYKKEYSYVINYAVEYVFLYSIDNERLLETARITVESNATNDVPLTVVVRQKRGILSWEIPLTIETLYFSNIMYNRTSRVLCSPKYYHNVPKDKEFIAVSLSTANHQNISFKLNMTKESEFYLSLEEEKTVEISPSEPTYYGYLFPEETDGTVIVHIESDSDICMTASIQNISCPVFDLERNIEYAGVWQTISRQGGIFVSKNLYPKGFFVVLVVKGDDSDCSGQPNMIPLRNKKVKLTIHAGITQQDYIIASSIAMSILLTFCFAYIASVIICKIKEGKKLKQELLFNNSEQISDPVPSPSTVEEIGPHDTVDEDSSLDEDDIDIMEDILHDKDIIRTKLVLSVCDLARKDPKILMHKSRLYLYYLLTVAIFYALPVMQLVITNQHMLHITGDQDMCYYNFLCSNPFGLLSDFNHVFSNFGYIVLGLLFVFLTYSREHNKIDRERNKCYGIPQHFGLFYAMGTALIMEGIFSGCYHVCPNRSNFQFDTSFMYVITVLCMIKIYQTRHPDINARAPVTFGVLALTIFIALLGVWNGSTYFWIVFTMIHLLICFFLTCQIYYMGRIKYSQLLGKFIQNFKQDLRSGIRYVFRPLYPARFVMLVVANLCNVVLAVLGNLHHTEFAIFLLAILMSNLILYTIFYIVMKICHKERILLQPLIYIILSVVCWTASLYFFINKTISWAVTPAQSRLYNKPCQLLNFFDNHDIWHFLSALAMFFSFMVLFTLDDDLVDVHRSQIAVF